MKQTDFYQDIERFSLLNAYYAYMDTDAYLADQLFINTRCGSIFERNMRGMVFHTGSSSAMYESGIRSVSLRH